jgi:hypothetical protein
MNRVGVIRFDSSGSEQDAVANSCEHGNESSESIEQNMATALNWVYMQQIKRGVNFWIYWRKAYTSMD